MKVNNIEHEFVAAIPEHLGDGKLYVSLDYGTVAHKCACGCGEEVITPLSPTDWKLIYDGETVSLYPSIGNWSFKCQSHYWIDKGEIKWAEQWSRHRIEAGRSYDNRLKSAQFGNPNKDMPDNLESKSQPQKGHGFLSWLSDLFRH